MSLRLNPQAEELLEHVAALVRAGVPIESGLEGSLAGQSRQVLALSQGVRAALRRGESLEAALRYELGLAPAYGAVLIAGFTAGRPAEALETLVQESRSANALAQRQRIMWIYPTTVAIVAYGLFLLTLNVSLPRLVSTVEQLDFSLPPFWSWIRWLEANSLWWGALPPTIVAVLWVVGRARQGSSRTGQTTGWSLIPGAAELNRRVAALGYCRLLRVLVKSDVPWPTALRLAGAAALDPDLALGSTQLQSFAEQGLTPNLSLHEVSRWPENLRYAVIEGPRLGVTSMALAAVEPQLAARVAQSEHWQRTIAPAIVLGLVGGTMTLLYALAVFVPLRALFDNLIRP